MGSFFRGTMLERNRIALAGCCSFGVDRIPHWGTISLVEIQDTFVFPPKKISLEKWRAQTPKGVVFSVRASQFITHDATSPGYRNLPPSWNGNLAECGFFQDSEMVRFGLRRTMESAEALLAQAIVFETPPTFTPTEKNRRQFAQFFGKIDRKKYHLIWHPRGIWSPAEITKICQDLALVPCVDTTLVHEVPAISYLRLFSTHYSEDDLLKIAELVSPCETTFCVFSYIAMAKLANRLQVFLGNEKFGEA
ncbi:MAG: DUF72 domain-containing protein [Pseudomonadota bacterium]